MNCFACWSPKIRAPPSNDGAGAGTGPSSDGGEQAPGGPREFNTVPRFTIQELADATEGFANCNFLGRGGFGMVFRGSLQSGEPVAVKVLNRLTKQETQGINEFTKEVLVLSKTDHPNIVKLLGFCAEKDDRLLVYEYMSRGSLEKCLRDVRKRGRTLEWNTRVKIATHVARGLLHLHETSKPQLTHRDLKPANILLDNEFNAKLGDFGISKFAPVDGKAHVLTTMVMETAGYLCPEYVKTGRLTVESDVYSFGVILLELLSGRMATAPGAPGKPPLLQCSRSFLKDQRKFTPLGDPLLEGRYPDDPFDLLAAIASTCIHEKPAYRPTMVEVATMLESVLSEV